MTVMMRKTSESIPNFLAIPPQTPAIYLSSLLNCIFSIIILVVKFIELILAHLSDRRPGSLILLFIADTEMRCSRCSSHDE